MEAREARREGSHELDLREILEEEVGRGNVERLPNGGYRLTERFEREFGPAFSAFGDAEAGSDSGHGLTMEADGAPPRRARHDLKEDTA
jgi:hypothetical protein